MDRFFDFIEKHRFGILTTFVVHMGIFLYLQLETYSSNVYFGDNEVYARIEVPEEMIPIEPDEIEIPEEMQQQSGEVKNLTKDVHDKREKVNEGFSRSSVDNKVEQDVKNLEQEFFNEYKNSRPQTGTSGETTEQRTSNNQRTSTTNSQNNESDSSSGGDKVYAGRTMVNYDLEGRKPHNNNDWYIRNPGYTCGSGSNGTVVIAIRVNQNGDVISARYVAEKSVNANNCMIQKAEEYALKSRFAYKESAPKSQDGFIMYNFDSK